MKMYRLYAYNDYEGYIGIGNFDNFSSLCKHFKYVEAGHGWTRIDGEWWTLIDERSGGINIGLTVDADAIIGLGKLVGEV